MIALVDGQCSRCHNRPVKVKWLQLCGACHERMRRAGRIERNGYVGRDPWRRLEEAALRLTRAIDFGWTERAVESAREQLRRSAEGYRRARRRTKRAA